MKRELTVGVAGVAILVAGISGCSSDKSSTGSNGTASAGTPSAAAGTISAAASTTSAATGTTSAAATTTATIAETTSAAPGGTSWNITLNGQAIAKGVGGNMVTCGHGVAISPDPSNPSGRTLHIVVSGTGAVANLIDGTLQVQQISMIDGTGTSYLYDPKQVQYHFGGGDAQATQSGNTYTITGHIAPYQTVQGQTLKDATPVPFEFDATCP